MLHNTVTVGGEVIDIQPHYTKDSKSFYKCTLSVVRRSGNTDPLPFIMPEKIAATNHLKTGSSIIISGEVRSANYQDKNCCPS